MNLRKVVAEEIETGVSLHPWRSGGAWARRAGTMLLGIGVALGAAGCFGQQPPQPIQVMVSEVAPIDRPAKGPNCKMPVLHTMPNRAYTEVAVVEGWGDPDDAQNIMRAVISKACETGADGVVILDERSQKFQVKVYQATPNSASLAANNPMAIGEGNYLKSTEDIPQAGSPGHPGYYVDAAAITYSKPKTISIGAGQK